MHYQGSFATRTLRDLLAVALVALFMFPIFWWSLASIKPYSAIFNKDGPVYFDFQPTTDNYRVTLLGVSRVTVGMENAGGAGTTAGGASSYDSRSSLVDSVVVAVGSTFITLVLATLAAYALSRMRFRGQQHFVFWVLSQRFMPPIAIAIPIFFMFRDLGLRDNYAGLILAHTLINLPLAVLLLKSFFDDVPKDVDEAAMIDGATRFQTFQRIILPLVRGELDRVADIGEMLIDMLGCS